MCGRCAGYAVDHENLRGYIGALSENLKCPHCKNHKKYFAELAECATFEEFYVTDMWEAGNDCDGCRLYEEGYTKPSLDEENMCPHFRIVPAVGCLNCGCIWTKKGVINNFESNHLEYLAESSKYYKQRLNHNSGSPTNLTKSSGLQRK